MTVVTQSFFLLQTELLTYFTFIQRYMYDICYGYCCEWVQVLAPECLNPNVVLSHFLSSQEKTYYAGNSNLICGRALV